MRFFSKTYFLRFLGWVGLLLVACLAAHPWVLAPLIPLLASSQGVEIGRCEIQSYTRWNLKNVSYSTEEFNFQTKSLQIRNPLFWFWENPPFIPSEETLVTVSNWTLKVKDSSPKKLPVERPSFLEILEKMSLASGASALHRSLDQVNRWIPRARAEVGHIEQGSRILILESLDWDRGTLEGKGEAQPGNYPITLFLDRTMRGLEIKMEVGTALFSLDGSSSLRRDGKLELEGKGRFLSGPYQLQGEFPEEGPWPEILVLEWNQPDADWVQARLPGLRPNQNDFLAEMTGRDWKLSWNASGEWNKRLDSSSFSEQEPIPWNLDVDLRGDATAATVQSLLLNTRVGELVLAEPFRLGFEEVLLSRPVRLQADINFEDPFFQDFPLLGQLDLDLTLKNPSEDAKALTFLFSGTGEHAIPNVESRTRLIFAGSANPEQVDFENFKLEVDDTNLQIQGWVRTSPSPDLQLSTTGLVKAEDLKPFGLPVSFFSRLQVDGKLEGAAKNVAYTGDLEAEQVKLPGMTPFDLDWNASNFSSAGGDWAIRVSGESTFLEARGRATLSGEDFESTLELMNLRSGEASWQLDSPVTLAYHFGREQDSPAVHLDQALILLGQDKNKPSRLELSPLRASIEAFPNQSTLQVENLRIPDLQPWVETNLPALTIKNLVLYSGEADFSQANLSGQVEYFQEALGSIEVSVDAVYQPDALFLNSLEVSNEEKQGIQMQGQVPLRLRSSSEEFFSYSLLRQNPLALQGSLETGKPDFQFAGENLALHLLDVRLAFELAGTLEEPTGTIQSRGKLLELAKPNWEGPISVENWKIDTVLTPQNMRIEFDPIRVQDTEVSLEALLAIEDSTWDRMRQGDLLALAQDAQFTLSAPNLDLQSWAAFLPPLLLPQGEAQLDLSYTAVEGLGGSVQFQEISLNPASTPLKISNLGGEILFQGYQGNLKPIQFNLNNRPSVLQGSWSWDFRKKEEPVFDIQLQGEGIPLVREADLLLRSDLDLRIVREAPDQPVRLAGKALLRDGLFIRPFLEFVQPGTASAQRQPPYFRIETEPYQNWELDIELEGDQFMRINAPVAQGVLSADLRLLGTLETPYLLGTVSADRGSLKLPFGVIRLESGLADFGVSNPYNPTLNIRGNSKTLGYSIDLLVAGSLENPDILFESDPALSPDEVLLLLTTGALPESSDENTLTQSTSRLALYLGRGYFSDLLGGGSSTERLRIRSGETISESGRETFQVEYDLSEEFSVIGEYDEYDDYNLDLRWKVRARK